MGGHGKVWTDDAGEQVSLISLQLFLENGHARMSVLFLDLMITHEIHAVIGPLLASILFS